MKVAGYRMKRYRITIPVKAVYVYDVDARNDHEAKHKILDILEHVEPDKTSFQEISGHMMIQELGCVEYDSDD